MLIAKANSCFQVCIRLTKVLEVLAFPKRRMSHAQLDSRTHRSTCRMVDSAKNIVILSTHAMYKLLHEILQLDAPGPDTPALCQKNTR